MFVRRFRVAEVMDMTNPPHAPNENAEKDTSQWVTGDEPMTGPQRSYLDTLGQEAEPPGARRLEQGSGIGVDR